ncbi:peptidase S8 [Arachnia propionica]|uniref:Peptidase S8 n=1 Tax=Arachnia propionica TaxID=1750 RepID=A0A3P1WU62_9ACTN|nr:peptidase S8 [Arachnia propionica]
MSALALLVAGPTAHADERDPNSIEDLVAPSNQGAVPDDAGEALPELTGEVDLIVQLEADPVAVVAAKEGVEITGAKAEEVADSILDAQEGVARQVSSLGGEVIHRMHSAYNGMRIRIDAARITELRGIPGVKEVHAAPIHERANHDSVPATGVPAVWQGGAVPGLTGKGIKVAVIDSGIDYTHATFGGEGTLDAYEAAVNATTPQYTGRVKGGYDFAGDGYDGRNAPQADENPLDCERNGHGTHVAGTLAGSGVLADGSTYTGTYDENTHKQEFRVGPGVAPEADIYALKVFGCSGGTSLATEAIDWAVKNDMDIINLSLGSSFGRATDPDSVAAANAVAAGVVVVAAAGNSGPAPYLASSPAVATGVISVAASDPRKSFPGATLTVDGATVTAINANAYRLIESGPIHVMRNDDGSVADGCDRDMWTRVPHSHVVVTQRGGCARVLKAINGQRFGALAVVMVSDTDELPPYEGLITRNPETGEAWRVRIPFLGVKKSDGDTLVAADGKTVTFAETTVDNPNHGKFGDFSSAGPRSGDSAIRPSVTAPGVTILSAAVGTGTRGEVNEGTSMASPYAAGVAALAKQAHPDWSAQEIAAVMVTTADTERVADHTFPRGGGMVDPVGVVHSKLLALGDSREVKDTTVRESVLAFGFAEFTGTHEDTRTVTLVNKGDEPRTLAVSAVPSKESLPARVTPGVTEVTVPANGSVDVPVSLSVKAADVPSSLARFNDPNFREVSGNIHFEDANGEAINIAYLLVPRSLSDVKVATTAVDDDTVELSFTNEGGIKAFTALYNWGLADADDIPEGKDVGQDIAAVGVSAAGDATLMNLSFAVNTSGRWSNAAPVLFNVLIDNDNDGVDDFSVFSIDSGLIRERAINGRPEVFVTDLKTQRTVPGNAETLAPTDSSTVVMQVPASLVGVTGKFTYTVTSTSLRDTTAADTVDGKAVYDPLNKPFADGRFFGVAVGETKSFQVDRNASYGEQKPLGYMAVVFDNASGRSEALTGTLEVTPAPVPPPVSPSPAPSTAPTAAPTVAPTAAPTATPTVAPTAAPTVTPTAAPTTRPTAKPTPITPRPGLPRTGTEG